MFSWGDNFSKQDCYKYLHFLHFLLISSYMTNQHPQPCQDDLFCSSPQLEDLQFHFGGSIMIGRLKMEESFKASSPKKVSSEAFNGSA